MKGFATILRRELAGLFFTPLAWVLLCLALFYNAFFFLYYLRQTGGEVNTALEFTLGGGLPFWFLVMLLPPLLTMRMISEESRSGMLEFVLTAPVGDGAVVCGKALAAAAYLAVVWATVLLFAALVHALGAPPDWGQVATGFLGAVFVSALFSAVGILASALSGTPILAAFLATITDFVLVFLPVGAANVRDLAPELVDRLVPRVNVVANFQASFLTGALDSAHVVFFTAWTAVFLGTAILVVQSRRWRA